VATIASVNTALQTAVLSGTGASVVVAKPVSQDYAIAKGVTALTTLPVVVGEVQDSNTGYLVGSFAIRMNHKLSDTETEDSYLTGDAVTDQAVIMVPSFYRDIAGVYEVVSVPAMDLPSEPVGNVIEYTVTVQLSIQP
jgi:hypothetical protein